MGNTLPGENPRRGLATFTCLVTKLFQEMNARYISAGQPGYFFLNYGFFTERRSLAFGPFGIDFSRSQSKMAEVLRVL